MAPIGINDTSRMWTQWKELIKELITDNMVICLGTSSEGDYYWDNIAVDGIVDLFGETTISEAVKIIKESDLFIGGETGLSHIANFYNHQMIIIFQKSESITRASHCNEKNVTFLFRPTVSQVLNYIP